ncbi:MAG: peroxiredoxin [archaeon]|nr:peroxiredoxin [archaeon]
MESKPQQPGPMPFPCMPCCGPKAAVRKQVPPFKGTIWENGDFKEVTYDTYKGKWLVMFFYPRDFTFVCPTEICAFSDASEDFAKINTVILGVSTDSEHVHREFALKERKAGGVAPLKIPLLADPTHRISKDFGCYIPCGPDEGAAFRATYIIDPEGIVRHISINDLPVGRSTEEVMRLVQALQFAAKNGEVCPMNWKPGKKSMKPKHDDPELKKFFEDELAKK